MDGLASSYSIVLALLQEEVCKACVSVEVGEAPPNRFLLAHVFTPASTISMGAMERNLVRPQ